MTGVRFTVYGDPVAKGSKSSFVVARKNAKPGAKGAQLYRAVTTDVSHKSKSGAAAFEAWRVAISDAAIFAMQGAAPLTGTIAMTVTFWLAPPKHESRAERERIFHAKKPDGSKLLRFLEDPLSGFVYTDDARIAVCRWEKRYARDRRPGADVCVTVIPDGE